MTEPALAGARAEPKLRIDKLVEGGITCLKFVGTIDEQFEGKKLAATLNAETLVLDLAEVHKILEVQGKKIPDAAAFAASARGEYDRLSETGGALRLLVQSGDGEPRLYSVNVTRRGAGAQESPVRPLPSGSGRRSGGVNIWDRTGGGAVRDDPDE